MVDVPQLNACPRCGRGVTVRTTEAPKLTVTGIRHAEPAQDAVCGGTVGWFVIGPFRPDRPIVHELAKRWNEGRDADLFLPGGELGKARLVAGTVIIADGPLGPEAMEALKAIYDQGYRAGTVDAALGRVGQPIEPPRPVPPAPADTDNVKGGVPRDGNGLGYSCTAWWADGWRTGWVAGWRSGYAKARDELRDMMGRWRTQMVGTFCQGPAAPAAPDTPPTPHAGDSAHIINVGGKSHG